VLLRHLRGERIESSSDRLGLSPKLVVLTCQMPLHDCSDSSSQAREDDLQDHGHSIARLVAVREEVRRPDITQVSENVDNSSSRSSLLGCLTEGRYGPGILQSVGRKATSSVQEHHSVASGGISGGDSDYEAEDGATEWNDDVETTLAAAIRVPSNEECTYCAQGIRRSCHEQRSHAVAEAKASYDLQNMSQYRLTSIKKTMYV
jgi:hypothetical protein